MKQANLLPQIRKIIQEVSVAANHKKFTNTENLYDKMILDSYHIVQLVVLLEERFRIVVDFQDLQNENFRSVKAIQQLLNEKYLDGKK